MTDQQRIDALEAKVAQLEGYIERLVGMIETVHEAQTSIVEAIATLGRMK